MKKTGWLLPLTAIGLLAACSQEAEPLLTEAAGERVEKICLNLPALTLDTRTDISADAQGIKYVWAEKDTIGIFPMEGEHQVAFSMKDGAGTNAAVFTGGDWGLMSSATYAAYFPAVGDFYLDKKRIPVNFSGQVQVGNNSTAHLGAYDFLATRASVVKDGTVTFNFERLACPTRFDITVPEPGTLTEMFLFANDFPLIQEKMLMDLTEVNPYLKTEWWVQQYRFTMGLKEIVTSKPNEVVTVYAMLPPVNLDRNDVWVGVTMDGISHQGRMRGKNMEAGKAYAYAVTLDLCREYVVKTPGTLAELIGPEEIDDITHLKVAGPLNGSDIQTIRKMAVLPNRVAEAGTLKCLDLSEARIVAGGDSYVADGMNDAFSTEDDVVGRYMFEGTSLDELLLPKTCRIIRAYALSDNQELKRIEIPESVESVESGALYGCKKLEKITGKFAEADGRALVCNGKLVAYAAGCRERRFEVPTSVHCIGNGAFKSCMYLERLYVPNSVTQLEELALEGLFNVKRIELPETLTEIPNRCFNFCEKLEFLEIPNGVKRIGEVAFGFCSNLKEVYLPETLETIEHSVFGFCEKMQHLTIPHSVTKLDWGLATTFHEMKVLKVKAQLSDFSGWEERELMSLKELYLPATTQKLSVNLIGKCVEDFYLYAVEPPVLDDTEDCNEVLPCRVWVPAGCLEKYKQHPQWGKVFTNFAELPAGAMP